MKAIIFDLETTGLTFHPESKLHSQPRAIEFGGIVIEEDGSVVWEFSQLIDPKRDFDESIITKITGLRNDDVRGQPEFIDALPKIKEGFAMADMSIAHNHPFDESIIEFELRHAGEAEFPWPRHRVCTVQTFQEEWGKRPKLTDLYEQTFNERLEQTHRAIDDCRALARIVVAKNLLGMFL